MSLAMAKKALAENREQFLDPERDPVMCNLHTALYQIVQSLERLEVGQQRLERAIAQLASKRR